MISSLDLSNLDVLAAEHSKAYPSSGVGESLRKIAFAIREYQRVSPAEERAAWDGAYAAALSYRGPLPVEAAICADKAIEQRRERFGGAVRLASLQEAIASEPRR